MLFEGFGSSLRPRFRVPRVSSVPAVIVYLVKSPGFRGRTSMGMLQPVKRAVVVFPSYRNKSCYKAEDT
jgi:hypothetical protein